MYTAFAEVYDRLMRDVDYDAWAAFYAGLLEKRGVRGGRVCECACGTASLTVRLQRQGFSMTGVDISQEMLSAAAEKARGMGQMIPFVRQDMCALKLHRRQDAVLCTCDGLNYLLAPDRVRRFFRAAMEALRPGGALAFDVSTPWKLENLLGDKAIGSQEENLPYIWQNAWHPRTRTVDLRLSVFVRGEDGRYDRLEEEQRQRAYTREQLTEYLTEAGFAGIRFYGDRVFRAPGAREARWHVTAVRPKENKP